MATYNNLPALFGDIADAIRGKTGSAKTIVADKFPAAISSIQIPPSVIVKSVIPTSFTTIKITATGTEDFSVYNRAVVTLMPSASIVISQYSSQKIVLGAGWTMENFCSDTYLYSSRIENEAYTATGTLFEQSAVTLKTKNQFLIQSTKPTYLVVLWRA